MMNIIGLLRRTIMQIREILPPSMKRVALHTNKKVNEIIEQNTIDNIYKYRNSNSNELAMRIEELDREWDTERVLEANAAAIIFVSTILGFTISSYWFVLVSVVSFFLFQHAVQGWCPPLPIIRRLGVRTPEEINSEKMAIKFLQGDFNKANNDYVDIYKTAKQ